MTYDKKKISAPGTIKGTASLNAEFFLYRKQWAHVTSYCLVRDEDK